MHQLGLLDGLLQLPHQRVTAVSARIGDFDFDAADFRLVPTHCKFVALMPQWDFLNFLSERAKRFDSFELRMGTRALD
jgi:2-polyprenyl-6-methoxyphenol hydroxylase-like FAD-dependent oxidoreductase